MKRMSTFSLVIDVCRHFQIKSDYPWWNRINHSSMSRNIFIFFFWTPICSKLWYNLLSVLFMFIFWRCCYCVTGVIYIYIYGNEKESLANHRLSSLAWFNASKPYELCFSSHCIHIYASLIYAEASFVWNVVYTLLYIVKLLPAYEICLETNKTCMQKHCFTILSFRIAINHCRHSYIQYMHFFLFRVCTFALTEWKNFWRLLLLLLLMNTYSLHILHPLYTISHD